MASRQSADKLKPLPPDPDCHQHSAIPLAGQHLPSSRAAMSVASIALTCASTSFPVRRFGRRQFTRRDSLKQRRRDAFGRSAIVSIVGSAKVTGRSLRTGARRSRQRRIATVSPPSAISTALRVNLSASPSSSASMASVVSGLGLRSVLSGFAPPPLEAPRKALL